METRQVEQVKIYKLILNNMTSPKIEYSDIAAIGYSRQSIIDFCEGEKEPWRDDRWGKTYRQGSILEWFNPPSSYDDMGTFGHGIEEEWVNVESLNNFLSSNPGLLIEETVNHG